MKGSAQRPDDVRFAAELARLRRLAYLLDEAFRIPVVGWRFGLDPLLGLVPVIGDFTALLMSGYLIARARRLGAPTSVIGRMAAWALLDFAVGSIPVLGDVLDAIIKPNKRSWRLLERYLARGAAGASTSF